jgi:GNAT superfamily N-acetyltransferase
MTTPIVKTATADDEPALLDVLTLAFVADPFVRWLWPDARYYLIHGPSYIREFGGKAFAHGTAYYIDGRRGAALWLPPDANVDRSKVLALALVSVSRQIRDDAITVLKQAIGSHPSEPHWFLPIIGTDPIYRRQGYGSALMRDALDACDRDKTLAYVESTSMETVPFYVRHGFEVLTEIKVGSGPIIIPMVRKPRGEADRIQDTASE